ncbi:ribbon-helix-helix domain-containing protein [candidate division WOR-3 bacterium]|nr:ribbon-helix-helix domain-containing protein [candidate division WOR-3 bacterium]
MPKTKITISINEDFLNELDKIAKLQQTNRSKLIDEALKVWEKERIEAELKQGYLAMAKEDKKIAEENLKIIRETLNE